MAFQICKDDPNPRFKTFDLFRKRALTPSMDFKRAEEEAEEETPGLPQAFRPIISAPASGPRKRRLYIWECLSHMGTL